MLTTDIIIFGRLYCDMIFADLDGFPELGKERYANDLVITTGGGVYTTTAYLNHLGCQSHMVAELGNDMFSRVILDNLNTKKLATDLIRQRNEPYYSITVAVPYEQERAFITKTDLNPPVKNPHDSLKNVRAKHVHICELATLAEYPDLPEYARSKGMTVSMDSAWDEKLLKDKKLLELIRHMDVFFTNEVEALYITDQSLETGCVKKAANQLEKMAPTIVVKCGEKGAIATDGSGNILEQAAPQVKVVDTIGAGDAFNAGFLQSYLGQKPLTDCLKLGALCGSLSVTQHGGADNLPSIDVIMDFLGSESI